MPDCWALGCAEPDCPEPDCPEEEVSCCCAQAGAIMQIRQAATVRNCNILVLNLFICVRFMRILGVICVCVLRDNDRVSRFQKNILFWHLTLDQLLIVHWIAFLGPVFRTKNVDPLGIGKLAKSGASQRL